MNVSYNPTNETVEVECFRGMCRLENPLGTQLLKDQQKGGATVGTPPTEPLYLDPVEVQDFQGLPDDEVGEMPIAVLEAVFGFCAGCFAFGYLIRWGLIPAETCQKCEDLGFR